MERPNFQNLRVYRLAEELSDQIWAVVSRWDAFSKQTVGLQIVKAADSVGANIAEGTGRGSHYDNRRFVRIARGSLGEVQHWLRRALARDLLDRDQITALKSLVDELSPGLNAYLRTVSRRAEASPQSSKIKGRRSVKTAPKSKT